MPTGQEKALPMQDKLTAGATYTGVVTQKGIMKEDGLLYEARQKCTLKLTRLDSVSHVECEIVRMEDVKLVNGSSQIDPHFPEYIRSYLSSNGSCVEYATGTYDTFSSLLILRSNRPTTVIGSAVVWSPQLYTLVVTGRRITGPVFCLDTMDDRNNDVGTLAVEIND